MDLPCARDRIREEEDAKVGDAGVERVVRIPLPQYSDPMKRLFQATPAATPAMRRRTNHPHIPKGLRAKPNNTGKTALRSQT